MESRKYTKETLEAIQKREFWIREQELDVLIKPIPETDEKGVMDPRFYESIAPMMKGVKGAFVSVMMKAAPRGGSDVAKGAVQMRKMMGGVKSIPIVDSVKVEERKVPNGEVQIPVRIYTPIQKPEGLAPVFYFIHGGGFVTGSMDVTEELCKLVVENTGCTAIQPDYRLAPEHPYPAGHSDCYEVLKWTYSHAEEFGGDPEKLCICGDSAGGNLATVCAMKDRDEGTRMVKAQALLYPSVDAAHMEENMNLNKAAYEISEKHSKVLNGMLDMMRGSLSKPTLGEYLGVEDDTIPYISPSLGKLEGMPPSVILLGEFDFLRTEDDLYARKLKQAGNEVKLIRYLGLSHGFADQIGVTPQAEDAMQEIGRFMMEQFAEKKG